MKHSTRQFLPLLLLAALIVFMAIGIRSNNKKEAAVSPMIGREFPVMVINGTETNLRADHQVALINVFASWCAPCAIEQPALVAFANQRVIAVKGLAWKDKVENMNAFLTQRGNPYLQIAYDPMGDATLPLGLTGVPESFLVDKNGFIRYHSKQPLTAEILNNEIMPLAMELQSE